MNGIVSNPQYKMRLGDLLGWKQQHFAILNLANSYNFRQNRTLIIKANEKFFLLSRPIEGENVNIRVYRTLRGAKIAFAKFFSLRALVRRPPGWTCLYPVNIQWLNSVFPGFMDSEINDDNGEVR